MTDSKNLLHSETSSVFTRDQLKTVFDMVAAREDWKLPVVREIFYPDGIDHDLFHVMVTEAVIFFTGSVPTFRVFKNNPILKQHVLLVEADGYYSAMGESVPRREVA